MEVVDVKKLGKILIGIGPFFLFYQALWAVTISIDASQNIHPISPLIYGIGEGTQSELQDLNISVNRWGGDESSTYNWTQDSENKAADWYFEDVALPNSNPNILPDGSNADIFYTTNKGLNINTMMAIPMIGYMPGDRTLKYSYSVAKYGAQQQTDPYLPDAGNGILSNGSPITNNNPSDAYVPEVMTGAANSMQSWLSYLVNKYGTAQNGGIGYYILDNEPGLWSTTHMDIVKTNLHDNQLISRSVAYATMIKNQDPSAQVVGFEDWGWEAVLHSPYDWQVGGGGGPYPDQAADYPNSNFMQYYLSQMNQASQAAGKRLLDVITLHVYPQEANVNGTADDPTTQALRLRSTRLFWDPTYVDQSWYNTVIDLIPNMQSWVSQNYPGTKVGITEYYWGALNYPDGGIAQADILGIFGRQGLDLATGWLFFSSSNTPGYNGFKIYRNYDGNHSTFGDTSISDTVPNPDTLSSFASLDSTTGEMKIIILSKIPTGNTNVTANILNFKPLGVAKVYQWAGTSGISRLTDINFTGNTVSLVVPAYSATMLVISSFTAVLTATPTPVSLQTSPTLTPLPTLIPTPGLAINNVVSYPNPVGAQSHLTFYYELTGAGSENAVVTIKIYSAGMNLIRILENCPANNGENTVDWDTKDLHGAGLANGLYYYSITVTTAGDQSFQRQKLAILR